MQCGEKLNFAGRQPSSRASREHGKGLSDIEEQILRAAMASGTERICFIESQGGNEGEIKAGDTRIHGDDALAALNALLHRGLVVAEDDGVHVVTAYGRRAVETSDPNP
jgi:hypothetical protein